MYKFYVLLPLRGIRWIVCRDSGGTYLSWRRLLCSRGL